MQEMSDQAGPFTPQAGEFSVEDDRVAALLKTVETLAADQIETARAMEAQQEKAGAILRAMPGLMFILLRDGTYVDYHARDPKLLLVPPSAFIGRKISDVLPQPLANEMMSALERACQGDEPVVVEYELPLHEPRFFEARIVQLGSDRLLSIVRDVTDLKRTAEVNRDLARRLVSSREVERQRIARELHDDISQRIAALNIEIDHVAKQTASEEVRARLRMLSAQARDIAVDVHRLSYELHPSKLQVTGLVAALQSLCDNVSKERNVHVVFTHGDIPESVDADISLSLYRIVQEALHNVVRHSRAASAQVSLACDDGRIALQIADSGVGFDPVRLPHVGLGLVSMRERVSALEGQLSIDAVPGGGTQITVLIPLMSQALSSPLSFRMST
jgi:signal transduction histidine kinase